MAAVRARRSGRVLATNRMENTSHQLKSKTRLSVNIRLSVDCNVNDLQMNMVLSGGERQTI